MEIIEIMNYLLGIDFKIKDATFPLFYPSDLKLAMYDNFYLLEGKFAERVIDIRVFKRLYEILYLTSLNLVDDPCINFEKREIKIKIARFH